MPPSNAMENDKKRLRNQFTKDERSRLLAIMTEYGPLLDDKNISILSRKEIWAIIENKFNENGHSGRTSAQLKKYWQNYKYHSKRTKIIHKEVPKPLSPMTKQMVRMLAKVDPEEWAQYDVAVNAVSTKKSPGSPKASPSRDLPLMSKMSTPPTQRSSKSSSANGTRSRAGGKTEISESNVVVSTTDVPGSSVTVSVICPEVNSSKARTIFWKRNTSLDNIGPVLQSDSEVRSPEVCNQEPEDPLTISNTQSGKLKRRGSCSNRVNIVGMLPAEAKTERSDNLNAKSGRYPVAEDGLVQSVVLPVEKVPNNRSPRNKGPGAARGRTDQSELIGNVIGVVKTAAHLSEDWESMEMPGSLFATNGRSERTRSVLNPFSSGSAIQRDKENLVIEGTADENKPDIDYSELNQLILQEFAAVKGDATNGREDSFWVKVYLRLLGSYGQAGGARRLEVLRKFGALISAMSLAKKRSQNVEESDTDRPENDRGIETDEDTNPEGRPGKLRVRRVSLMPPAVGGDQIQREIKVEREIEPEADAPEDPLNDNVEENLVMNSMNYLVQAKLQYAKSELDHQLELQKLEMEEKGLRVRIAEMTIQEIRLRIQALVEERLRAKELHELRVAQMTAEKVRSEAEHAVRMDASCVARAEGQARINSIERDRERSENFYQIQLRCMSGGNTVNGNCSAVKCKQYQHQQMQ